MEMFKSGIDRSRAGTGRRRVKILMFYSSWEHFGGIHYDL